MSQPERISKTRKQLLGEQTASKAPRMFHVAIAPTTHRRLKVLAAASDTSMGVLIDQSVDLILARAREKVAERA